MKHLPPEALKPHKIYQLLVVQRPGILWVQMICRGNSVLKAGLLSTPAAPGGRERPTGSSREWNHRLGPQEHGESERPSPLTLGPSLLMWFPRNPTWHPWWLFPSQNFPVLGPFLLLSHLLRCPLCFGKTQDRADTLCVTRPRMLAPRGPHG